MFQFSIGKQSLNSRWLMDGKQRMKDARESPKPPIRQHWRWFTERKAVPEEAIAAQWGSI
jgi:hypothetical protein